jgi:hypothetical protein
LGEASGLGGKGTCADDIATSRPTSCHHTIELADDLDTDLARPPSFALDQIQLAVSMQEEIHATIRTRFRLPNAETFGSEGFSSQTLEVLPAEIQQIGGTGCLFGLA